MCDACSESIAVGFFDGVHLGHQSILRNAASVLTFRNHPLTVLSPERAPMLIMGENERLEAIARPTKVLDFTEELSVMSPDSFAESFLGARKVVCGEDWHFGRGGEGDVCWLERHGYEVEVAGYAEYRGERISSSRIRRALARGEIGEVSAMLGRSYRLRGKVVPGKGLGHELGFPTVNLELADNLALARGVYAVDVGGCRALANYGLAPTMGDMAWENPILEVHFLDGRPAVMPLMTTEFLRYVRPEEKFDSLEALKSQVKRDILAVSAE